MSWSFWLELVARSSGLLLFGEVLRRLSKAQGAAFRHKLLLWVLLLLAFLPALSIVLPEIRIPAWSHARPRTAVVTVQEVSSAVLPASAPQTADWPLLIWLAGVLVASAPVLMGAISAYRVAHRAKPFQSGLPSPGVEILISSELSLPLTCGFWRPRILLPAAAGEWSSVRMQAVLLHELAHVRRRDVAAQIVTHLLAALWWFQPLVWMLRRGLRAESELACDAEALQSGLLPSAYAAELLAVAESVRRDYRLSSCAIGMTRGSDLEQRVRVILKPAALPVSRTKICGLAVVLAMVAAAASALNLQPNPNISEQGGSIMKRTLISGLLTSVGLSAATVSGTVHDPGGAAVADATVLVFNPDTGAKQQTTTDGEGKFSLDGSGAGQYILKVEKSGFATIFREFDLKAESQMQRVFTMTTEGTEQGADQVVNGDEAAKKPIHVGGQVAQSNLITKVQPVYPAAAKTAHTQGTVEIEATISKDGVPVELQVVSTPSSDLAESALEAVRQWRYRPTLLNGEPVEIITTIIVNYTLSQ